MMVEPLTLNSCFLAYRKIGVIDEHSSMRLHVSYLLKKL